MNGLGLVYCSQKPRDAVIKKNFLKRFLMKAAGAFRKEDPTSWIKRVDPDADTAVHLIKLPYSTDELAETARDKNLHRAELISEYCAQNRIGFCAVPEKISVISGFESLGGSISGAGNPRGGMHRPGKSGRGISGNELLYKALLVNILRSIYTPKGIRIHELDITIVHGDSLEELKAVIRLLSPHVRYLTVYTDNKEQIESELSGICDETGLSVIVTCDRKNCLKHAGLVINLGTLKRASTGNRMMPGAVLINFREPSAVDIAADNTVINGIEVKLPKAVEELMDDEIFGFFSACEIAGLLLCCKTGCTGKSSAVISGAGHLENISKEFMKGGYIISRFIGKYNTLNTGDIKL